MTVLVVVGGNIYALVGSLLVTWLVCTFADYGSQGSAQVSYGFKQVGISYVVCVVSFAPAANIDSVLYRVFGIIGGVLCTLVCFQLLSRDYAGHQLLRTLLDVVRPLPELVNCPPAQRQKTEDLVFAAERTRIVLVPETMKLIEEAFFEQQQSGIRNKHAMEFATLVRWVSVEACAVATARSRAPTEAYSAYPA